MQVINSLIKSIRLRSFVLFFLPLVALLTALLLTNHLVMYNSSGLFPDGKMESLEIECNLNNRFCVDRMKKIKFHECNKYEIIATYYIDGKASSLYDHGLLHRFLIGHGSEGKVNLDVNQIKLITKNANAKILLHILSNPIEIFSKLVANNLSSYFL